MGDPEKEIQFLLPENSEGFDFLELELHGKLLECIDEKGGYTQIRYKSLVFSVRAKEFLIMPKPIKSYGEVTHIHSLSQGKKIEVEITDITWDWARQRIDYSISVDGRKKNKRYIGEDFIDS